MMQTPELLLTKLNQALRELRGAARVLDNVEIDDQLLPVMRRLTLAEIMNNRWLIAVGGTQGAGKTTLIRTLYGLDDNDPWLPANEGRGETLPILVEEHVDIAAPQGWAVVMQPREDAPHLFVTAPRQLTSDEFVDACRGQMREVLLPVLRVPRRHFQHSGQALILLPGYEPRSTTNEVWQDLMRQALVGAAGCVIVTDATRLANKSQQVILKDMLDNELRTVRPLVVISKTEAIANNADKLAELRQSAVDAFALDGADTARQVFCAGVSAPGTSDGSVPPWLADLGAALRDMSLSGTASRQVQLAKLEQTLSVDLTAIVKELRLHSSVFARQTGGGGGAEETMKHCIAAFDDACASLREDHQRMVGELAAGHSAKAWTDMETRLIQDHEGLQNKIMHTFDSMTETQRRLEKNVLEAWHHPGSILEQYTSVLGKLTAKSVGPRAAQAALPTSSSVVQRLGYVDNKDNLVSSPFTDPKVQANLNAMLRSRAGEVNVEVSNEELEATAALLPAMVLEFTRIASALPQLVHVDQLTLNEMPPADLELSASKVKAQFVDFTDASRGVLKGIAAVMAIDIASDGHADILNAVMSSVGIGTATTTAGSGAAAAAGLTIGGAVVGVIAIGYIAHSALQEVRRHDGQVRSLSNNMLQHTRDHHQAHFAARYDELMNIMRNHLKQGLRRRYGLDLRLMEQDRLQKALADVRVIQQDLLSQIAGSGHTMALFGAGAR